MNRRIAPVRAALAVLCLAFAPARADEVTIGYQLIYNPWKAAIADGLFEEATGYEIDWKRFDSGSKVITAMASGRLHIALAGSSPIAAGVSRGLPIELFWIRRGHRPGGGAGGARRRRKSPRRRTCAASASPRRSSRRRTSTRCSRWSSSASRRTR